MESLIYVKIKLDIYICLTGFLKNFSIKKAQYKLYTDLLQQFPSTSLLILCCWLNHGAKVIIAIPSK